MRDQLATFVAGDSTKCTGCKACEVACFVAHNKETDHIGKTVGTVTVPVRARLFLTRAGEHCMPVQCKHCEDAPCLNACTKAAVIRVNGKIVVNEEKCIGCKDCMVACPFGAVTILPVTKDGQALMIEGSDEQKKSAYKCDFCTGLDGGPACVVACPHQALSIIDVEENRLEKNIRAAKALALLSTQ